MKKTRLNKTHREFLTQKANETVLPKEQIEATQEAYKKMFAELKKVVSKYLSPASIKTLKKFDLLKEYTNIKFFINGKSDQTIPHVLKLDEYDKNNGKLKLPYNREIWGGVKSPSIGTFEHDSPFILAMREAEECLKNERISRQQYQDDMRALINQSRTFEEVVAVWEGAEKYRSNICKPLAISTLDTATIKRIKSITA